MVLNLKSALVLGPAIKTLSYLNRSNNGFMFQALNQAIRQTIDLVITTALKVFAYRCETQVRRG